MTDPSHPTVPPDSARSLLYHEDRALPLTRYLRYPAYKRLLNQLVLEHQRTPFTSLAIVSHFAGEGKSFCAAALALGFAKLLRKRTLIVDTVHQTTNRSLFMEQLFAEHAGARGDGDELSGSIEFISTRTIGRDSSDVSDFLLGPYLASLKPNYDVILIDTCALKEVGPEHMDPLVIAKSADAAILITSNRSLERDILDSTTTLLNRSEVRLLGAVYNQIPAETRP